MAAIHFGTSNCGEKRQAPGFTAARARGAADIATKAGPLAVQAVPDPTIAPLEYRRMITLGAMLAASIAIVAALVKLL